MRETKFFVVNVEEYYIKRLTVAYFLQKRYPRCTFLRLISTICIHMTFIENLRQKKSQNKDILIDIQQNMIHL